MNDNNKEEEATEEVNAPEPNNTEESSSNEDNLETDESTQQSSSEVAGDYLADESETSSEDDSEVDYKKRYADSTREYQKIATEKEQLSKEMEALEKLAQKNPNIIAEINKAREMAGEAKASNDEDRIDRKLEDIQKKVQELSRKEDLEKVKIFQNFERRNPDLFPPNATAEEKKAIRNKIGRVANTLVDTGMDLSEAVDRAYLTINPKAAEKAGRDKAYAESLTEEQAGFSSQTSAEGKRQSKTQYTKEELDIASKMGDKYKEAMLKDS